MKDAAGVASEIVRLHDQGVRAAFLLGAVPDSKDSKRVIAGLAQGGLTLPDRDYYLKADDKMKAIRKAYRAHVEKMLTLLGDEPKQAADEAAAVIDLETQLAKASRSKVELRDPEANYNLMGLDKLEATRPASAGRPTSRALACGPSRRPTWASPTSSRRSAASSPAAVDAWKTYLRWHLNPYAGRLSSPFVTEDFQFNGTVLNGVPENRPRWKRVWRRPTTCWARRWASSTWQAFPPEAKARPKRWSRTSRRPCASGWRPSTG